MSSSATAGEVVVAPGQRTGRLAGQVVIHQADPQVVQHPGHRRPGGGDESRPAVSRRRRCGRDVAGRPDALDRGVVAEDQVDAGAAVDVIPAGAADQQVVVGLAVDQVVPADGVVGHGGAVAAQHAVDDDQVEAAVVAEHHVVARAGAHQVAGGARDHHVDPGAGGDGVHSADRRIGGLQAGDVDRQDAPVGSEPDEAR